MNPRTGRTRRQPTNNSFLFDHQKEKHNSAPPNFKLRTKRYYGSDRLACQVAEAVSLKMRTGEILNLKTDFSATLLTVSYHKKRNLQRLGVLRVRDLDYFQKIFFQIGTLYFQDLQRFSISLIHCLTRTGVETCHITLVFSF